MRFRLISLISLVLLIGFGSNAQQLNESFKPTRNHVLFELGGAGIYGSLNYERLFFASPKSNFLYRVGFFYYGTSYIPHPDEIHSLKNYIVPVGITWLSGVKHHLELGLNNTIHIEKDLYSNSNSVSYLIIPTIGYRFENFRKRSIYYSIGFTPWIRYEASTWEFQPSAKVGVGYSF